MKILVATPQYAPMRSGLAIATTNEVALFRELGHEVSVVTGFMPNMLHVSSGAEAVHRFAVKGNGNLFRPLDGDLAAVREFVAGDKWDLVVAVGWQNWASTLAIDAIQRRNVSTRILLRSHGLSTESIYGNRAWAAARWLGWRHYRHRRVPKNLQGIDALVLLSDLEDNDRFLDARLARKAGTKTVAIPNLTPSFDVATNTKKPRRAHNGGFICVGAGTVAKNELAVLNAYRLADIPSIPLTFIVPRRNDYCAAIEQKAKQYGLSNVRFIIDPSSSDFRFIYQNALATVSASLTECQPLAILDGIAFGVPYIATPMGDLRDHPGGLIVSHQEAMAAAMHSLATDPQARLELSNLAFSDYQRRFAPPLVKKAWKDLLDGIR